MARPRPAPVDRRPRRLWRGGQGGLPARRVVTVTRAAVARGRPVGPGSPIGRSYRRCSSALASGAGNGSQSKSAFGSLAPLPILLAPTRGGADAVPSRRPLFAAGEVATPTELGAQHRVVVVATIVDELYPVRGAADGNAVAGLEVDHLLAVEGEVEVLVVGA